MNRRDFLTGSGAALGLGLMGINSTLRGKIEEGTPSSTQPVIPVPPLAQVHARTDRIIRITVCLRPFRAKGPRIETEKIGQKTVVHN
ncbi:MAG TPA: twin-arginine translocation signal domain-containing protein, partial [Opitutaceae bacterium]|nr:twin-arginine translocation signal domain-containing protein [Opitutaceae bacterium]